MFRRGDDTGSVVWSSRNGCGDLPRPAVCNPSDYLNSPCIEGLDSGVYTYGLVGIEVFMFTWLHGYL